MCTMPNPMIIRSGECKKFSPNIFNKTKCTNCFKQKEEHSAEALESNRATRKVAKCGYLFVAPGWDFSNPINRTKRWQRRWFVLYDDGELSYSLDEHPETVPQACIDMNKVVDVTEAEELTGNPYSLAITTHDEVHFVKATSREETKWWMDVLSVFPRSKGRHKRNATFPVSKSVTNVAVATNGSLMQPSVTSSRSGYFEMSTNCDTVCADEKSRNRRSQNREKRSLTTGHNYAEDLSKMVPTWHEKKIDLSRRLILEEFEADCKLKDVTDSLSRPPSRHSNSSCSFSSSNLESLRDVDVTSHKQVRGDPDGCGLDLSTLRYSPNSEMRIESVSEDLLNIKKGWLMKQVGIPDQEWNKYWFVLRGAALLYYRDPTSEDQGILDGVIDLSVMSAISEVQVARNYGFQIKTWDERQYVLSAVTAGIRANWMSAIKRAAGLQEDANKMDSDKELQQTSRSILLSSDDEYRTASENGRQSSSDWGETLPPSPPLNRTPISRVKERARGVTRTRLYNSRNSKSSPPSSRRSTLDSVVRHQDILTTCAEVSNVQEKSERSSLMKKLEKQAIELEEVKRQLTAALRQLSSAEEELLRLRQKQSDVAALEKQMEDTMKSLKLAEETLKQKHCELSEYETFKIRCMEEKSCWQEEIRATACELRASEERYSELCCELASSREHVEQLRNELASVSERLARGIEENESLYRRVRELEGRGIIVSSIRETKARSLDSLSDLTNIDFDMDFSQYDKERIVEEYEELRARFEKAVQEIRAMKKELRESNIQNDCLEINLINARQDLKCKQQSYESQASLMAARVQDLTNKLSNAEKQIRLLKQKLSKSETREKRRSLSLKGRESFAICKELEEKLLLLEKRISLLDQENAEHFKLAEIQSSKSITDKVLPPSLNTKEVSSRIRRKSLDSATSSEPMKILIRMNSLEAKVMDASRKIVIKSSSPNENLESTPELDEPTEINVNINIANEIKNIENLLKKKLTEIYSKQKAFQESGSLTDEMKLKIMAEKLAYESILVCRLQEIAAGYNSADIADAERLMLELDKKLRGEQIVTKSPLEYFTKSLSQYLNHLGKSSESYMINRKSLPGKRKESTAVKMLQKKSNALTKKVDKFIAEKIEELSNMFVSEIKSDAVFNDDYVQNIIELTRETVNNKLIQVEVSQIMLHCVDNYVPSSADKESAVESLMIDRANLEQWSEMVHSTLIDHVENALTKLKQKYEDKTLVAKLKDSFPTSTNQENLKYSLQQFVDIIAHKCLLDARLHIIKEKDSIQPCENEITKLDEATIMSEVQYLYAKIQSDLKSTNNEKRIFDSLESVGTEVSVLRNSVEDLVRKRSLSDSIWDSMERIRSDDSSSPCESASSQSSWLEGVCKRCIEIKEQIIKLQTCLMQSQECQKCLFLQEQLKRKETEFEEDKQQLENQHTEELTALRLDHENERNNLITKHDEEVNTLREKSKKLERRLSTLDSEYSQQIDCLRSAYQRTPSPEYDKDFHCSEESIRQRYQKEIEHLKALCEKGLVAMDNSHKRIIVELEEKHRQEIESLRLEKDQALAEETQATLAALDAMRKAHEAEVQKEIVKFKTEYLKKLQSSHDIASLHKEHEAEMEEIKREILSLSEKYSVKCVESAALEEELRITNNQLAQAQHHIMQLDNRNKQLRAHLISETNDSVKDENLLQQLEERTKQISSLQEQFSAHDDTLNTLCMHLNSGDLDYSTLNALLEKLRLNKRNRRIDSNPQNINEEKYVNCTKNRVFIDFIANSEVKKCKVKRNTRRSPSPSSVSGMVAERKKIFEP